MSRRLCITSLLIVLTLPGAAQAAPTWLASVAASPDDVVATDVLGGVNAQGTATAVWRDHSTNTVFAATRAPGFPGFNGAESLSEAGAELIDFAVGPTGVAVAAWRRAVNGKLVIEASTHVPGSIGFGPGKAISDPDVNSSDARVAVDGAGNATVIWHDTKIEAATMPAGASTFSAPTPISGTGADQAQVATNAAGDLSVVWRVAKGADKVVQTVTRPAGAAAFTTPKDISGTGVAENPQIAIDGAGAVTTVWDRFANGTRTAQVATCPAGKSAFTEPQELSDLGSVANDPRDAKTAVVAVDDQGDTVVAWRWVNSVSRRVQAVTRPAGSATFTATQDLSIDGTGLLDDLRVAMGPGGHALAGWTRGDGTSNLLEVAERPAGAGAFMPPQARMTPGHNGSDPDFGIDADGDVTLFWDEYNSSTSLVLRSSVEDLNGPMLTNFSVPATATVQEPVPMSVLAADRWSPPATVVWSLGDGSTALGASTSHAYDSPGTYTVTASSVDAVGNTRDKTATITVTGPMASPTPTASPSPTVSPAETPTSAASATPGASATSAPTPPAADTVAPVLTAASLAPRRLRRGVPGRLRYTLSEAATVATTVQRGRPGRLVGKRCRTRTRRRRAGRCVRYVRATPTSATAAAGANARTVDTAKLRRGRYRVTLIATDTAGNRSAAVRLGFRVVPGRRPSQRRRS